MLEASIPYRVSLGINNLQALKPSFLGKTLEAQDIIFLVHDRKDP